MVSLCSFFNVRINVIFTYPATVAMRTSDTLNVENAEMITTTAAAKQTKIITLAWLFIPGREVDAELSLVN